MEKTLYTKANKEVILKKEDLNNMNMFDKALLRQRSYTTSGNGSTKLTTTGNVFVDDFASISKYREPRTQDVVNETMATLWSQDALTCLKEMCYIRMITRDTRLMNEVFKSQKGQGLRAEYIRRLYWLVNNEYSTFKQNFNIFIAIGSWMDMFQLLRIDLEEAGIDNKNKQLFNDITYSVKTSIVDEHLEDEDLVKKYLPQIKASRQCKTFRNQCNNYIAKYMAVRFFEGEDKATAYKKYRLLKSSGKAHEWEQMISRQKFNNINWDTVAGRAITKLMQSKFLDNHDLTEEFVEWADKKDAIKFTGYPYELMAGLKSTNKVLNMIADKQFKKLLDNQDTTSTEKYIVCLDSSGSMTSPATGLKTVSALDVAQSMGLYFSYFLDGEFKNHFLEFSGDVAFNKWVGETPSEKIKQTEMSGFCGSTNFLAVADALVNLKMQGFKETDFPTGVICVSDGEFNSFMNDLETGHRGWYRDDLLHKYNPTRNTIFEIFRTILKDGGFSEDFVNNFKLVLWDVPNSYYGSPVAKFESFADAENVFYMSGFDPAGIAFLMGSETKEKKVAVPRTAEELFEAAMNQEVLNELRVA